MLRHVLCALLATVLCDSPARAARLGFAWVGESWAMFLNGEQLNGQFNAVGVDLRPANPHTFTNIDSGQVAGSPRPPGDPFTYYNRRLNQDAEDGGLGWNILGLTLTSTQVAFLGGPLGQMIDTSSEPFGWLFLANLHGLPPATTSVPFPLSWPQVRLVNLNGQTVWESSGFGSVVILGYPIVPEPAAGMLAGLGLMSLAALRRRGVRGEEG